MDNFRKWLANNYKNINTNVQKLIRKNDYVMKIFIYFYKDL